MQALLLSLALLTQTPQTQEPPPSPPTKQPPAPTKQPPIPGKTLPMPVPPTTPAPQAPPAAPAKLLPQEQRPPVTQAAQEVLGPDQQVWINQYGCYCVGQQIKQGPPELIGKWRVKYRVSTPQGSYTYTASGYGAQSYAQYGGDPYGFINWLNNYRASRGRGPVAYDPGLSGQAAVNNSYGFGHSYMGSARRQNAGMGAAQTVWSMWTTSPAHNDALLDPSITRAGIAANGSIWTFNAY